MNICPACDTELAFRAGRGRPQKYCNEACRSRFRRASAIPVVMTERRAWVRADGKRPVRPDGYPASSTDSDTWTAFADVQRGPGDGFGVMLGGDLGCYDLDGVTDVEARRVIAAIPLPILFVERSLSGNGVHVFVKATESAGGYVTVAGIQVERYTRSRFIRMTGQALLFR